MPVHDLLARRRRVMLPVHPGFGASEGLEAIESMEDLVFHTLDVLDALGLDRVDVVGLSLGGWLAAELALRHPGRVERLVLVDAAGVRVPSVPMGNPFMLPPAKVRELMFHDPTLPVATAILPDVPPPERLETVLRGREAAARLLWNPAQQYRKLTSRLWRIGAPTLVVWGREDRVLPLAYAEAYARGIPGARLEILDRCGHLPPFERPERFAEIVLDFLEGG
jgi:pimeloyl-ACP methyl ester carboxylesterase